LRIPAQMQRVGAPSPFTPRLRLRSSTCCPESLVGCAFAVAHPPRYSLLPFAACVRVLPSCPQAPWECVCIQPPALLSCGTALRAAAPADAHTAGKAGASTVALRALSKTNGACTACPWKQEGCRHVCASSMATPPLTCPSAIRDRPALPQVSGFWRPGWCPRSRTASGQCRMSESASHASRAIALPPSLFFFYRTAL
jgi:hypothetical protein